MHAGGDDRQPPCGDFWSANVCCGQMAGWTKIPLDMVVG